MSIYDTDIFDVISRVRSLYQPSEVKQSQFHLTSKQSCLFTNTRSCMERRNVVCPCDREVSSLTILDKFAGIRTSYLGSADDMILHVKRKVTGRNF